MVRFKKTIGIIALALLAAGGMFGSNCNGGDDNEAVTRPYVVNVWVTPAPVSVIEDENVTFVATCQKGSDWSTFNCTNDASVIWSFTGNLTATATKGVFKAGLHSAGANATVTAGYGNVYGSAAVTILKITSLILQPEALSIIHGGVKTMTAICFTSEGPNVDCTAKCTWGSDAGITLTTLPSTFTADISTMIRVSRIFASVTKLPLIQDETTVNIVTALSGKVIAVSIDPSVGMVQGEQVWFNATCTFEDLSVADCTRTTKTAYEATNFLKQCSKSTYNFDYATFPTVLTPVVTDAPWNNCWEMDYKQGNPLAQCPCQCFGGWDQSPQIVCPGLNASYSYIQVTYTNTDGSFVRDQADIHCRELCDITQPVNEVFEEETVTVNVACEYSDLFSYACNNAFLNYKSETVSNIPFITWDITTIQDFAVRDETTPKNILTFTTKHIPGPCGAAIDVGGLYTDGEDLTSLNDDHWFQWIFTSGAQTILNDDQLVTLKDIRTLGSSVVNTVWMDTLDLYDATCIYDRKRDGAEDLTMWTIGAHSWNGSFDCSDVYTKQQALLNPTSLDWPALFAQDTQWGQWFCHDAFGASWAWYYPTDDCDALLPPDVFLPDPNLGAWTGMFSNGFCGHNPPQNYAYSNYLYYTNVDNAATLISGEDSEEITLDFIDHSRPDWLSTTETVDIRGGYYVVDPLWDKTSASVHRPAIHPMLNGTGGNWVSLYVDGCPATQSDNKCDQIVRVMCQAFSTGTWSQCVNNIIDPTPNWISKGLPAELLVDAAVGRVISEFEFRIISDPGDYLMKTVMGPLAMNTGYALLSPPYTVLTPPATASIWATNATRSGSWTRVGAVATITLAGHGYAVGNSIDVASSSDSIPAGAYLVASVIDPNTFTIACVNAGALAGNISIVVNGGPGDKYSYNTIYYNPAAVDPAPGTCDTTNFAVVEVRRNPWWNVGTGVTEFESVPGSFVFIQVCNL